MKSDFYRYSRRQRQVYYRSEKTRTSSRIDFSRIYRSLLNEKHFNLEFGESEIVNSLVIVFCWPQANESDLRSCISFYSSPIDERTVFVILPTGQVKSLLISDTSHFV